MVGTLAITMYFFSLLVAWIPYPFTVVNMAVIDWCDMLFFGYIILECIAGNCFVIVHIVIVNRNQINALVWFLL